MEEKQATTQKLIDHKEKQSVIEFATMLEKMAKKLKEDGKFTFVQGTERIEVSPINQLKVEYEYEVKGDKHEFEMEIEWNAGENTVKTMNIE
jgi:amphi-Trp domain-containing protein